MDMPDRSGESGSRQLGYGAWDADAAGRARDKLIFDLVCEAKKSSVRLRNSIERGHSEERLPCRTVADYVAAGPSASALFMGRLRNFGRRTAGELDALVDDYLGGAAERVEADRVELQPPLPSAEESRMAMLHARLSDVTIADAVLGQAIPPRLESALREPGLSCGGILEILSGETLLRAKLLRLPNFGRTSMRALELCCRRAVIRTLAAFEQDRDRLMSDCALVLGFETSGEAEHDLAELVDEPPAAGPPADGGLEALLDWAMSELDSRELDVLRRRYRFDDRRPETLEEIGLSYRITRERIRQVEKAALRKLWRKLRSADLDGALEAAADAFWERRSSDFLCDGELYEVRRELPPHLALALDVANRSPQVWLEAHATPMQRGMLRLGSDPERVRWLGAALAQRVAERLLPISMAEVFPEVDERELVRAAQLETSLSLFEGYLFKDRPQVRAKRAVRLHALLAGSGRSMSLYELGPAYWSLHHKDRCGLRDLVIVMEIAPHLFLEIEEGVWVAVGRGAAPVASSDAPVAAVRQAPDVDETTIAGILQQVLRTRGPTKAHELYRDGDSFLPQGRSRISIGPILLGRPELFIRVLPGVYALPEQVPTAEGLTSSDVPYLLNPAQGRYYALGRRAGERWGTFPLWTAAAEYRLCRWARFEAEPALFHSLLSVACIDAWPVAEQVRDEWSRLARQRGRFELPVPVRMVRSEPRPSLDRLLAACIAASERGSLNWLLVNRIMGRRIDATNGRGLLALMLALGALRLPANAPDEDAWQLAHAVTDQASDLARLLGRELAQKGEISWDSVIGRDISSRSLQADQQMLGWARLEALAELVGSDASVPLFEEEEDEEEDAFGKLMREHRRESHRDKRAALAQWLLEE